MPALELSEHALDQRARRAARRVGLVARKNRRGVGSIDNFGGYALIDPETRGIVCGWQYDLSADDVLAYCEQR